MIYTVYKVEFVGTANVQEDAKLEDIVQLGVPVGTVLRGQYMLVSEEKKKPKFVTFKEKRDVIVESSDAPDDRV